MSNFSAEIQAKLNTSGIANEIKRIENSNINFRNVSFDTSRLVSDIQSALNNSRFTINLDRINMSNISNQMQRSGSDAGRSFSSAFSSSLNNIHLKNGGIGNISNMLMGAGFNKSSIASITQDLDKMVLTINKLSTKQINNGNIKMTISGVDEVGRAVQIVREFDKATGEVANTTKTFTQSFDTTTAAMKEAAQARQTLTKSSTLSNNMQAWLNNNAKAAQQYGEQIRVLQETLNGNTNASVLRDTNLKFAQIKAEAKAAGLITNSWAQSIKNVSMQVLGLSSSVMVIHKVINEVKEGINTIIDLDTALVDLQKTTTMSASELNAFYLDANNSAKQLGVTTKEIIDSAASWSRLGFSDKDSASRMAKLSAQMTAISPGMTMDESTTGLVSVIKAYGIETEDVLDGVMSKINIVGNTAATSNKEIIQGLQNSAAAMAGMDSTLEENIALFTAAQEITQDASKVGNALRSISLRVRGYDEETEQYSEDLANITGQAIDLTKTASNPQGVSLFTDETQTEYKGIYEYLKEISEIYDELGAKEKQDLMETLFGKNRANIGQAILQNFEAAEKAMGNMANSAGNADAEMAVVEQSIEFKLNSLQQTWVGVWQNLLDRGEIGGIVDMLTSLLEIVDAVTEKFGLLPTIGIGTGIYAIIKNLD